MAVGETKVFFIIARTPYKIPYVDDVSVVGAEEWYYTRLGYGDLLASLSITAGEQDITVTAEGVD